ncbi:MAG: hypothetical protein Q9196_006730, partial [Gyalolechia fulgens]
MTQERPIVEKMERADSGFGDCPTPAPKLSATTRKSSGASSSTNCAPGARTPKRIRSDTQQTRPPSICQSLVSAYVPHSHPSSRSSSLILRRPSTATTPWNSSLRSQTHSVRSEASNPYTFHRECKSLFDPAPSRPTTPTTSTINHPPRIDDPASPPPNSIASLLPQPIVDWTLPSTRRREYRAIEASTKGFKGLWRRLAPKRWQRGKGLAFSEKGDHDDDGGSVRRYRIAVDHHDEDLEAEGDAEKR